MSSINKHNLQSEAAKCFTDPSKILTAYEISDILTDICGEYVPEQDVLDYRQQWLNEQKRKALQPVPLQAPGSTSLAPLPRTLQEMSSFSQIEIFGTLQGVAEQAFRVYNLTANEGDHKGSIQALRLVMDSSEAIDKKLKAMNAKDPSSIFIGNILLQNITDCLGEINAEHPDWHLLDILKEKVEARRAKQTTADIVECADYE